MWYIYIVQIYEVKKGDSMTKEEIKALRLKMGLTQDGMAKKLDTVPVCISRWECGKSKPSRTMLKKLNRLLRRG